MRQWRFNSIEEINKEEPLIVHYIQEAIANQKAGKEIKPEKNQTLILPDELKELLARNSDLAEKFEALNRTKRQDFATYIAEAKKIETRMSRLEKITPMIKGGIGLSDKYKKSM